MAISWNEIKDRSLRFSKDWVDEKRERAEKDTFWNEFFEVFGISRRRVATFEEPVKKLNNHQGFIDLFWKGTLLVEHKSKGGNLDAAFAQASDYFHGLKDYELPKYVLVSDFEKFKLYDLDERSEHEFLLKDLHKNLKLFGFIAGYQKRSFKEQDPVNIDAAYWMGKLHDQLEEVGYEGHPLEVFLVRILFCLFADDTGIFEKDTFKFYIEEKTKEDGHDLGSKLAELFQILDSPREKRYKSLDESLNQFPYVNGKLFDEPLPIAAFNKTMREILLHASSLDWGKISPAIFGSMFQSVMNPEERRNLGAHYTSEKNIMKLIKPLFLDELQEEFIKVKNNSKKLLEFHHKLSSLKFLDPACGCGNFLVITYREIRLLELEVLRQLHKNGTGWLDVSEIIRVDVDQFYGIEYDEWPARIAEVAMWLMDHQMNMVISEEFGHYFARLPLKKSAKIVHGNALRINWEDVIPKAELSYILGNPPFIGHQLRNEEQIKDLELIFYGNKRSGRLDYVAAWYIKSAKFIQSTKIKVAFVSTNSIVQGEQTSILWGQMFKQFNVKIHFAHKTFNWSNEAKGNAAVHCVIIGYSNFDIPTKRLFAYEEINGESHEILVKNISPYLTEGKEILIESRSNAIHSFPKMSKGSQPTDGGNLILTKEDKDELISKNQKLKEYIKKYLGSYDLLNNNERYCLWFPDILPELLREFLKIDILKQRLENVKKMRLASPTPSVKKDAERPFLFTQIRQPHESYLVVPETSSSNRRYIPIAYLDENIVASNSLQIINSSSLYLFGVLQSKQHNSWIVNISGRLKNDIRYTPNVYHTYPFPKNPSEKQIKVIETASQKVLEARLQFPNSSLADLYDPLTMPPILVKAHNELDKAVDLAYRSQAFTSETNRMEFLFELYEQYTADLFTKEKPKKVKKIKVEK